MSKSKYGTQDFMKRMGLGICGLIAVAAGVEIIANIRGIPDDNAPMAIDSTASAKNTDSLYRDNINKLNNTAEMPAVTQPTPH
ncbi:MAG TPA: hypothetical protein VGF14_05880 [Alphaproteobacteria bacterium]